MGSDDKPLARMMRALIMDSDDRPLAKMMRVINKCANADWGNSKGKELRLESKPSADAAQSQMELIITVLPEIWASIFCELPAVYLYNSLRCVHRSWDSLIRSSIFIEQQLHSPASKKNPGIISLFMKHQSSEIYYSISLSYAEVDQHFASVHCEFSLSELPLPLKVPCPFADRLHARGPSHAPRPEYSLSNPCDGLICLYDWATVYVMNPSLRRLTALPIGSPHFPDSLLTMHLPKVAMGFDSKSNAYKVVRIFICCNDCHKQYAPGLRNKCLYDVDISSNHADGTEGMRCEVYTLGGAGGGRASQEGSWKFIGKAPIPLGNRLLYLDYPVVVNNAIHWLYSYAYGVKRGPKIAVSFSLSDETFDVIHHPNGCLRSGRAQIAELEGCLCVCESKFNSKQSDMDIWMLKDYERRKWVKQYTIDLTKMHRLDTGFACWVRPMMIIDGKMVLSEEGRRVVYYDIGKETFSYEKLFPVGHRHDNGHDFPFIGSLIWPRV